MRRVANIRGHITANATAASFVSGDPEIKDGKWPGGGTGPVPAKGAAALIKVGDEGMFVNEAGEPDFPSGLRKMAAKVPPDVGLGYYISYRMDGEGNSVEDRVILCTRPQFIEEIMGNETEHYLWGGIEPASVAFFGARVLFVLEGEEWSDLRKTMRPVLLPDNLPMMYDIVSSTSQKFSSILASAAEKQEIIDLQLFHQCFHLQAVSKALYNKELPTLDNFPEKHVVHESFNLMLDELARRAFHPDRSVQFDYSTPSEDNSLWGSNRDVIHDNVLTSLRPRLTGQEKCPLGGDGDLLQQLIDEHRKDHPKMNEFQTESHLGANLVELLFAGYNTVVNTMTTAIYLLTVHPDKLQKARAQIDQIVGDKPIASWDELAECTYLDQIMDETLRLYSPTPAIGRKLTKDTQLGEVLCPAGTEVMMPMCAIHRDPIYWSDPDSFIPERFDNGQRVQRCAWMPFSDGPRRCLGQHYARVLFKASLTQHLKHFDFEIAPGHRFKTGFNGFGAMVWDDRTSSSSMPIRIKKRQA